MRIASLLALLAMLVACGSEATPNAVSPDDGLASEEAWADGSGAERASQSKHAQKKRQRRSRARLAEAEVRTAESLLPEGCNEADEDCLPPESFVNKLCSGIHPELALHMFRGGSPWKRLYSRATAPAFNGAGGPSISDERVQRGEELIALRRNTDAKRSKTGEMSIGATAGYDLLRWNGSCVTLHDGEFSSKPPRRGLRHANVDWRSLGDAVQSTLREDELIGRAIVARRKECRGITLGNVSRKCVEQEKSLVAAIVDYVRAGGNLPVPNERL